MTDTDDGFALVRGGGNVFQDFARPDAEARQLKAILAAQIIRVLDGRDLSVRAADGVTGIAAADFSRIRRARLDRFTIDRLMTILAKLDQKVDVTVTVRSQKRAAGSRPPAL